MEDLLKNQPKPKWKRKENELNTKFTYEELDNPAHEMIEEAMKNLKELFPYALLFNPKLSTLTVLNKTGGTRIKDFQICRIEKDKFKGISIFNANISEEGDTRTFSAAYIEDKGSTIAVPVERIGKNQIKLL